MRFSDRVGRAFRILLFRPNVRDEVREEIEFYLEMRAGELVDRGMSPEEARRAALAAFGDPARVEAKTVEMAKRLRRGRGWSDTLAEGIRDLRHVVRSLRRRPGYAITVVATLALGIGANTAIFTVVHSVLLRPLPYAEPGRLVQLFETTPQNPQRSSSPMNYLDARQQIQSFEHLSAFRTQPRNLLGEGDPERLVVGNVSANFFATLGVDALVGRTFIPEAVQPGEARTAVLSHDLWVRRFGSDPSLMGDAIRLDGESLTVVGVMPQSLRLPAQASLWIKAFRDVPEVGPRFDGDHASMRDAWYFDVVGRLKSDASIERAQAELDVLAAAIRQVDPVSNPDMGFRVVHLLEETVQPARALLVLLIGAVVFVLLIACVNVANLALIRASSRGRELGVRAALGASRGRLVRHLLGEGAVLGLAGGAAGLALAVWAVSALKAIAPGGLPRAAEIGLHPAALLFTTAVTVLTILVFGLFPALSAVRTNNLGLVSRGDAGGVPGGVSRRRAMLVVLETALALVLVLGATLSAESLWRLSRVDLGFAASDVVTLPFMIPGAADMDDADWLTIYREVGARVREVPGVVSAGLATRGPVSTGFQASLRVEGREVEANDLLNVGWQVVSADYFTSVGIGIRTGRGFDASDRPESTPVAVVNETLARTVWPNGDPIGQRINTGLDDGVGNWVTVVGVAADTRNRGPSRTVLPAYFRPLGQPGAFAGEGMMLTVRASDDPGALVPALQQAAWSVQPDLPFYRVLVGDDNAAGFASGARFLLLLLGAFAFVALLLGAVGIYGVVAYSAERRTREMGVRVALGAHRSAVLGLVLRQGLGLAGSGVAVGLVVSLALSRSLETLLFDVSPRDLSTYGAVGLFLLMVASFAALAPAVRASSVDPMLAIRSEG